MSAFADRLREELRIAPTEMMGRVRERFGAQRADDDAAHALVAELRVLIRANLAGELSDQKFQKAVIRLGIPDA